MVIFLQHAVLWAEAGRMVLKLIRTLMPFLNHCKTGSYILFFLTNALYWLGDMSFSFLKNYVKSAVRGEAALQGYLFDRQ